MTPTQRTRQWVLGIDPGTTHSAAVLLDNTGLPRQHAKLTNGRVLDMVRGFASDSGTRIVIEMVASYGMPVGREVFETVYWIGRFAEAAGEHERIFRGTIKSHLCRSQKANDSAIRQALVDRFGPGKDRAIGKKANPGPLYGFAGDEWAALAVAVSAYDGAETARGAMFGVEELEVCDA